MVVLATASPAFAQVDIEAHRLPEYTQTTYGACFDFPGFRELLVLDEDLHLAEIQIPELQGIIVERDAQVLDLRSVISNLQYRLDLYREDRARIFAMWTEENRMRHELEERPDAGSWIAWAVAGVSLAAAVILGVTLGLVANGT